MKTKYLRPEIDILELTTAEDILQTSQDGGASAGGVTDNKENGFDGWI